MPAICINAPFHSLSELISLSFNPAVWNHPAEAWGGMRFNPREVALSSASWDNSTNASNFTSFVFNWSHYCREPLAPLTIVSAGLTFLSPLLFGQNYVNVARRGVHFLGADHYLIFFYIF